MEWKKMVREPEYIKDCWQLEDTGMELLDLYVEAQGEGGPYNASVDNKEGEEMANEGPFQDFDTAAKAALRLGIAILDEETEILRSLEDDEIE